MSSIAVRRSPQALCIAASASLVLLAEAAGPETGKSTLYVYEADVK